MFNVEQCDGVTVPDAPEPNPDALEPIPACDAVVSGYPKAPGISHSGRRAFYRPSDDSVTMPQRDAFSGPESYYATLFHELTHATGHQSRLARKGVSNQTAFGSHQYSQEELVAEMGAAFLCSEAGILEHQIDQSAAYIEGWLRALRNDRKLVCGYTICNPG